jgi:transposase-like protein
MERKQWGGKQKLQIVLEGLSGNTSVSEICNKYQVGQTQYYKWRDQLFKNGEKIFEEKLNYKQKQKMRNEINSLKSIIGDLTVELKKTELELL